MAEAEGEKPSKGVALAYNIGVVLQVVDKTSKSVTRMAYAMERVKALFKKTESQAKQSSASIAASSAGMGGGLSSLLQGLQGGGGGGVMSTIMGAAGGFNTLFSAVQNIGSMVGADNPIMQLHSQSEDLQNTMAGTFTALGFADNMNHGLAITASVMRDINAAAAPLPGEANEYISVFRAGLPHLASGLQGNMGQMVAFSNQFTAVGRTFGIDADQIGRDMALMLRAGRGGAGADVATFQQMLPFINSARRARHESELTAESFNVLSQSGRFDTLHTAFASLQPMIEAAANSWGAMSGSIKATSANITLGITKPFFDFAKRGLQLFNNKFSQLSEKIIEIGARISTAIVGGIQRAMGEVENLRMRLMRLPIFSDLSEKLAIFGRGLGAAMTEEGPGGNDMRTGAVAMGARLLLGPVGMLVGVFMELGQRGNFVETVLTSAMYGIGWLMASVRPLVAIFGVFNSAIADIAQGSLLGLVDGLQSVAQGFAEFLNGIYPLISAIYEHVRPALVSLGESIGGLFRNIGLFLLPLLRGMAQVAVWLWDRYQSKIMLFINGFINVIKGVVDFVSDLFARMGRSLDIATGGRQTADNPLLASIDSMLSSITGTGAATTGDSPTASSRRRIPAARGGSTTHNDFRNSRFDVNQKFADGFDPDRIAVAFASDLEAMADRRLQSGFDPLFSVHR